MKRYPLIFSLLFVFLLSLSGLFACGEKKDVANEPETPECEHVFTYTTIQEPTESTFGKTRGVCSLCGFTEDFFISALNEEAYQLTIEESTCYESGKKTYSSEYGVFYVTIDPIDHEYAMMNRIAATCKARGEETYTCIHCGDSYKKELPIVDHVYEIAEEEEGTCDEKGYVLYRCTVGGETFKKETDYHHIFDEGVHTDVVCPDLGYTTYTCEDCGYSKVVYDKEPAHVFDTETGICTICGYGCEHVFDGYVCEKCGLDIAIRVREDGVFFTQRSRSVGEKVWMGMYPQSVVSSTETELLEKMENAEETDGYYTVDGFRYVKKNIANKNEAEITFSDGSYFASHKRSAYFREEPVSWTVISVDDEGNATLICDKALFAFDYCAEGTFDYDGTREASYVYMGDGFGDVYADTYVGNDGWRSVQAFTETAIDDKAKALFVETEWGTVRLPLYSELFEEEEDVTVGKESRIRKPTDYALGTGADVHDRAPGRGTYYRLCENGMGDEENGVVTASGAYDVYALFGEIGRNACFVPVVTLKGE